MTEDSGGQAAGEPAHQQPGPDDAAAPAVEVGQMVISWSDEEPVRYGGRADGGSESLSIGSGRAPVLYCAPERVAPADTPVPARDERVSVVQRPRSERPPGAAGPWRLTLPGVSRPSWHRTKGGAAAAGRRRLAILDWHAGRVPAAG